MLESRTITNMAGNLFLLFAGVVALQWTSTEAWYVCDQDDHRQPVYILKAYSHDECEYYGGCWDDGAANAIKRCYKSNNGECSDADDGKREYFYYREDITEDSQCNKFKYGCYDESASGTKCYRQLTEYNDDKCSCETSLDEYCFVLARSPCVSPTGSDCGLGNQLVLYVCYINDFYFGFVISQAKCCVGKCSGHGHGHPPCPCTDVWPFCGNH